jgi:hypothetical protein
MECLQAVRDRDLKRISAERWLAPEESGLRAAISENYATERRIPQRTGIVLGGGTGATIRIGKRRGCRKALKDEHFSAVLQTRTSPPFRDVIGVKTSVVRGHCQSGWKEGRMVW